MCWPETSGEGRSELAPGQGAAGSGGVVAHGAVGAEQLAAVGGVALLVEDACLGDGRAGAEGGNVGGQLAWSAPR